MTSKQEGEAREMEGTGAAHSKNDDPGDDKNISPITEFVTTSYVIDSINSALEDVMRQEEGHDDNDGGGGGISEETRAGAGEEGKEEEEDHKNQNQKRPTPITSGAPKKSYFELQKRMPDGSMRKATEEEMSSQDMKNKLEQAAQLTSKMDLEEKIQWASNQRQQGNKLYQEGNYKEAIDIYLTCLVVRDTTKEKLSDEQEVLIIPVMNNLAQCALQLGWYYKAEVFCTLAMESLDVNAIGQAVAKLYYKRGKARRLRGWYNQAKEDLDNAMQKLPIAIGTTTTRTGEGNEAEARTTATLNSKDQKSPEQKAIEREIQLLAKAVAEGKKNKKRAQRAMQKVLGSTKTAAAAAATSSSSSSDPRKHSLDHPNDIDPSVNRSNATTTTTNSTSNAKAARRKGDDDHDDGGIPPTTPLYHEKHGRTHSTIRKRPEGPPPYERPRLPPTMELNYWQMYRLVIARVAQRLLDIIGEEEGSGFGGGGVTSAPPPVSASTTGQRDDGNTRVKQD